MSLALSPEEAALKATLSKMPLDKVVPMLRITLEFSRTQSLFAGSPRLARLIYFVALDLARRGSLWQALPLYEEGWLS